MASAIYRVNVQWGDCDGARIVFYPNFFRWFDEAAWHLFASHGIDRDALFGRFGSLGIALVDARAQFHRPARFGDVLEIASVVRRWGTRSFELSHTGRIGGAVAVEGHETRIWGVADPSHPEHLRAGVIPEEVKALMPAETAQG